MKSFKSRRHLPTLFLLAGFVCTGTLLASPLTENLFVSNLYSDSIWEFSLTGERVTSAFGGSLYNPQGLAYPTGLTFDRSGNLYVANYYTGQVAQYGPGGDVLNPAFVSGDVYNMESLAFDSSGNLYIGHTLSCC